MLALYSRFWSEGRDLSDGATAGRDFLGDFRLPTGGLPERWATFALVTGVLVLGVAADLVRRGRSADPGERVSTWVFGIGAAIMALGGYVVSQHVPGALDDIGFRHPLFDRLTTAAAAILLVLSGTVLTLGLGRPAAVHAAGKRPLILGSVAGLLISAGTAGFAMYAGDDARRIDHTTAAAATVPAFPARLGEEHYRISVPGSESEDEGAEIVMAGTGFVLATTEGLTAYDGASGTPRWHYLRRNVRDGNRVGVGFVRSSLLSVDGGSVVLAQWERGGVTAFDAITGELLWTHSEFTAATGDLLSDINRYDADRPEVWRLVRGQTSNPASVLAATNGRQLARFDARTGDRMWSVELCQVGSADYAFTAAAIYRIARCAGGSEVPVGITAVNPATGAVLGSQELGGHGASDHDHPFTAQYADTLIIHYAANTGMEYVIDRPERLAAPLLPTPQFGYFMTVDSGGTEAVVVPKGRVGDLEPLELRRLADGSLIYRLTGIEGRASSLTRRPDRFLADQIIEANYYETEPGEYRAELRAWNRSDGTPATVRPLSTDADRDCSFGGPVVIPGAVLALCRVETEWKVSRTTIVGFASN